MNEEIIIAKGKSPIDDIPDKIKILFDTKEKINLATDDREEKVDYRNVKSISNVDDFDDNIIFDNAFTLFCHIISSTVAFGSLNSMVFLFFSLIS